MSCPERRISQCRRENWSCESTPRRPRTRFHGNIFLRYCPVHGLRWQQHGGALSMDAPGPANESTPSTCRSRTREIVVWPLRHGSLGITGGSGARRYDTRAGKRVVTVMRQRRTQIVGQGRYPGPSSLIRIINGGQSEINHSGTRRNTGGVVAAASCAGTAGRAKREEAEKRRGVCR